MLNRIAFDVPRLSEDIDLNYVSAESRAKMLEERACRLTSTTCTAFRFGRPVLLTPIGWAVERPRISQCWIFTIWRWESWQLC